MLNAVSNPNQFNISLSPEIKLRLAELAQTFKTVSKGKATRVGALIIETYIERWAELETLKEQLQAAQAREMEHDIREHLSQKRPPLVKQNPQPRAVSTRKKKRK